VSGTPGMHLLAPGPTPRAVCGVTSGPVTTNLDRVECADCLREMKQKRSFAVQGALDQLRTLISDELLAAAAAAAREQGAALASMGSLCPAIAEMSFLCGVVWLCERHRAGGER
jgi:hypothetical protein